MVADPAAIVEVTLGEVYRLVAAQDGRLAAIQETITKRPTWEDVNRMEKARDDKEKLQNEAIKALEDANRWLVRTVIAALLTGLVALAVAGIKLAGA